MAASFRRAALRIARLAGNKVLKSIGLAALSGGVGLGVEKILGGGLVSGRIFKSTVGGRGRRVVKSPRLSRTPVGLRGGGRRKRRRRRRRRRHRRHR